MGRFSGMDGIIGVISPGASFFFFLELTTSDDGTCSTLYMGAASCFIPCWLVQAQSPLCMRYCRYQKKKPLCVGDAQSHHMVLLCVKIKISSLSLRKAAARGSRAAPSRPVSPSAFLPLALRRCDLFPLPPLACMHIKRMFSVYPTACYPLPRKLAVTANIYST